MALTLAEKIEKQEKLAAQARKKIADLKQKARDEQTKRFIRIAEKHGYFDVEISDESLIEAIKQLTKAARSPQISEKDAHATSDSQQNDYSEGGVVEAQ
ncbi:hypothetical protein [Maritalea sp.]|uniref:hypothetical protein n=1 Tax=Maritalea sp. TaxID=2003361 RepID=UPI003EF796E3